MNLNAYRKGKLLELDYNELLITTNSIVANFIVSFVAILSIIFSVININLAGWIYFSMGPLTFIALTAKQKKFTKH